MNRKALIAIAALSTAAFAAPAMAQMRMSSAYIGGGFGQSKIKDACNGCDDKDTAIKLFGGYQFNRTFAAELGYNMLGKASGGGASVEATAWELSAVAGLPVANQFSVLGRLGLYHGEFKPSGIPGVSTKSNNGLTFGFGVQYDLNRNLGLRGEWQRFNNMGGGGFVETDVDVLSISALWRFQ
jgi:OOP family OmpA-OmpF porin